MNERTWGMVVWLGILGALAAAIASLMMYLSLQQTAYALVLLLIAALFAIMGAAANIGATRLRRQRWDGEMASQQQRVDNLFASAQTDSGAKSLSPTAQATMGADAGGASLAEADSGSNLGFDAQPVADEAAAEGESVGEEESERERAEHGNWE